MSVDTLLIGVAVVGALSSVGLSLWAVRKRLRMDAKLDLEMDQ